MTKSALLATTLLVTFAAAPASAGTVIALVDDTTLATIDTDAKAVTGMVKVGASMGKLLGIDVRPADGMLYGLFADGTVATIDAKSGTATKVETLKQVPPAGTMVTVDFNPVADAMRIMASDGTNLRTKITGGAVAVDGKHAFAADDMMKDAMPMIVAGAYTNSMKGADKTALYTIDGKAGAFAVQMPPNDGTQKTIGKLGVELGDTVAFDIRPDGKGGNEAWLLTGARLYAVDIATGKATAAGMIKGLNGKVRDMAIWPAM